MRKFVIYNNAERCTENTTYTINHCDYLVLITHWAVVPKGHNKSCENYFAIDGKSVNIWHHVVSAQNRWVKISKMLSIFWICRFFFVKTSARFVTYWNIGFLCLLTLELNRLQIDPIKPLPERNNWLIVFLSKR